jgi:hypothetical protein
MPQIYIIKLNGKLAYRASADANAADAAETHAVYGDTVTWNCALGDFAILFGDDTPFDKKSHSKKKSKPLDVVVPNGKTKKRYKYSVAVFDEGGGDPLTDDPQVIID